MAIHPPHPQLLFPYPPPPSSASTGSSASTSPSTATSATTSPSTPSTAPTSATSTSSTSDYNYTTSAASSNSNANCYAASASNYTTSAPSNYTASMSMSPHTSSTPTSTGQLGRVKTEEVDDFGGMGVGVGMPGFAFSVKLSSASASGQDEFGYGGGGLANGGGLGSSAGFGSGGAGNGATGAGTTGPPGPPGPHAPLSPYVHQQRGGSHGGVFNSSTHAHALGQGQGQLNPQYGSQPQHRPYQPTHYQPLLPRHPSQLHQSQHQHTLNQHQGTGTASPHSSASAADSLDFEGALELEVASAAPGNPDSFATASGIVSASTPPTPLYRFGPSSPFASFRGSFGYPSHPQHQLGPNHQIPHNHSQHQHPHHQQIQNTQHQKLSSQHNQQNTTNTLFSDPTQMSYSDEYDEGPAHFSAAGPASSSLYAVGGALQTQNSGGQGNGMSAGSEKDRVVRRRSSKACDQCRKSKCKCERAAPNEACKNCVMLGTPCTFLGPSRKRGPPKGYIDAIEARLHQTEALLGILLATTDERAVGVLRDVGEDPLAREIIARVDNSPYGVKGRKQASSRAAVASGSGNGTMKTGSNGKGNAGGSKDGDVDMDEDEKEDEKRVDLTSTHPSNEWQDRVAQMLDEAAARRSRSNAKARAKSKSRRDEKPGKDKAKGKGRPLASSASAQNHNGSDADEDGDADADEKQGAVSRIGKQEQEEKGDAEGDEDADADADADGDDGEIDDEEDDGDDDDDDAERDEDFEDQEGQDEESKESREAAQRSSRQRQREKERERERDRETQRERQALNTRRRAALDPLNTDLNFARQHQHQGAASAPLDSGSPYPRSHAHALARVSSMTSLRRAGSRQQMRLSAQSGHSQSQHRQQGGQQEQQSQQGMYSPYSHSSDGGAASPGAQARRQRRRLDDAEGYGSGNNGGGVYARSAPGSAVSLHAGVPSTRSPVALSMHWSERGRRGSGWSATSNNNAKSNNTNTNGAGDVDMGPPLERRSASVDFCPPPRYQEFEGGFQKNIYEDASEESEDEEALVAGAVGQLSLNEDEEVRYHGKASGLYLLDGRGGKERRNEGGIWRFPKARVWPALPSASSMSSISAEARAQEAELPPLNVQEHLLDLYFTYVQPVFPIVHKRAFFEGYRATYGADSPSSPADPLSATQTQSDADATGASSPFGSRPARRRRSVPSLLLLVMFALASRYCDTARAAPPQPADPSTMWSAGDEYLDKAKTLLDSSYASSRPSTVQALLLLGYREIGIGAMAQAWTYIGMAIRMAQDLGMHRAADGWERVGLGGRLFDAEEISERRRVWFGCMIMDKYVSTYIGRPLMIFECDFDTRLPDDEDPEEYDEWSVETATGERSPRGVPGRSISCFNASATLSGILSIILQTIYAVRPISSRHIEATAIEGLLDKWYLGLPTHLRFDPSSTAAPPLPNVLTLHMQYWCAVLLLHRPFIRHVVQAKQRSQQQGDGKDIGTGIGDDPETRAIAVKRYELCNAAANHITSIVSLYQEKYLITRCSVFLCYYVFTAGVMHDTNLMVHPNDPQAKIGLAKCLNVLQAMRVVWPSAARAIELFGGASTMNDINNAANPLVGLTTIGRPKRAAENTLDDTFGGSFDYIPSLRQPLHLQYHQPQHHQQQRQQHQHQRHIAYSQEQEANGVFDGDGLFLPSLPPMNTSSGPGMVTASPGYTTPWQDPHHFNSPLSTAVLPQLYSTGLVDDGLQHATPSIVRGGMGMAGSHPASTGSGAGGAGNGRRYPQYLEDYSGYSQMVPTYDLPQNVQVSQQQQQQAQHQIYLSEQYNLYSGP